MMPTAEELLAVGSSYYVENPVVPLEQTIVDINMDPLGRGDGDHRDLKNHIYIYCSKNGKQDLLDARASVERKHASNLRIIRKIQAFNRDEMTLSVNG